MPDMRQYQKTGALAIATALITGGLQQISAGDVFVGGGVVAVGLVVFAVYQLLEDRDHRAVYDDIIEDIGEENLRQLGELSGGELREIVEDYRERKPDAPAEE